MESYEAVLAEETNNKKHKRVDCTVKEAYFM